MHSTKLSMNKETIYIQRLAHFKTIEVAVCSLDLFCANILFRTTLANKGTAVFVVKVLPIMGVVSFKIIYIEQEKYVEH